MKANQMKAIEVRCNKETTRHESFQLKQKAGRRNNSIAAICVDFISGAIPSERIPSDLSPLRHRVGALRGGIMKTTMLTDLMDLCRRNNERCSRKSYTTSTYNEIWSDNLMTN
jgi:hypothetical protein